MQEPTRFEMCSWGIGTTTNDNDEVAMFLQFDESMGYLFSKESLAVLEMHIAELRNMVTYSNSVECDRKPN